MKRIFARRRTLRVTRVRVIKSAAPTTISRVLADVGAILAIVFAAILVPSEYGGLRGSSPVSITLIIGIVAAVLLRRRVPRTIAYSTILLSGGSFLAHGAIAASLIAVVIAVFAVGTLTNRSSTSIAALVAVVETLVMSAIVLGPKITDISAVVQIVASIGFAAAAGDASRLRRAYIAEITDRARQAEETKEAEARRRVLDERVAIARDLHDLIAHQIAVVSLNAGVASRALRVRPDDAERALTIIHGAAQTVLYEINGLLSVLRAGENGVRISRRAPVPGLAQLPELITEFASGGLSIRQRTEGTPRELPSNVDVVAYRALQEALTNVLKHSAVAGTSPASALLHLAYQTNAIVLTVTNFADTTKADLTVPSRSGHGLDGVRERVASVGGQVQAVAGPGPVYRFTAWLPTPDESDLEGVVRDLQMELSTPPELAKLSTYDQTRKGSVS